MRTSAPVHPEGCCHLMPTKGAISIWTPQCRMDNIKEWTYLPVPELLTRASCRKDWNRNSAESSSCPPDARIGQETELIEPKDTNYLDEWPNMSTHNFCHQTPNMSQSEHMRDDTMLH